MQKHWYGPLIKFKEITNAHSLVAGLFTAGFCLYVFYYCSTLQHLDLKLNLWPLHSNSNNRQVEGGCYINKCNVNKCKNVWGFKWGKRTKGSFLLKSSSMCACRCCNTKCKCHPVTAALKTPSLVVFNFPLLVILYNADLDFPPRLPSSHNCAVTVETSARCRDAARCDRKRIYSVF